MKNQILKLTHIRKRERKSLFLILIILFLSSFCDELYLTLLATSESSELDIKLENIESTFITIDSTRKKSEDHVPKSPLKSSGKTIQEKHITKAKNVPQIIKEVKHDQAKLKPKSQKSHLKTTKMDPNHVNMDDLIASGISRKVARTWINFSNAGGKFYKKEDLNKIYGISEEEVEQIAANLTFPEKLKFNSYEKATTIYLNQATAHDFAKISGIGPVLSERIIKLRDRLGGFHSQEQLKEVYGVEEELIEKNKNLFVIEKNVVKININTCNEKQLGAHSYCSYRTAKAIINYREQHGNFTNKDDFLEIRILDKAWIDKISPYFEY